MKNKGFALVALIFTVLIIAILVVMLLFEDEGGGVSGQLTTAKTILIKHDIVIIESALKYYNLQNGFLPTTAQGLNALMEKPTTPPAPQHWTGSYLQKLRKDPWGNPYQYRYPSTHGREYDIWSKGPDGKDRTDDDVVSWKE